MHTLIMIQICWSFSSPDPTLPGNPPVVSRCLRPDYQSYYLSCFKYVDDESYTYAQAKEYCSLDNAVLGSFIDRYELSFGRTIMYNNRQDQAWLGLERNEVCLVWPNTENKNYIVRV